jgi:hypothetical protein
MAMSTGLVRLVGTTIDTSLTSFHKYLLAVVDSGNLITSITITAKYMFASETLSSVSPTAVWSHSIGWVSHGASAPPFGYLNPSDDSILAYDLAEPPGLERVFWAPGTASVQEASSFTSTLRFRGQLLATENIDIYYLKDTNGQSGVTESTTTIAWSIWFGS